MALSLENCSRCNNIFDARLGSDICSSCHEDAERELSLVECSLERGEESTLSQIVHDTQLPRERVQSILRGARILTRGMRPEGSCTKCAEREAMPDCDYCLGCQLELFKSLGDLAADATETMLNRTPSPRKPSNLRAALHEKRRRTGTYRFQSTAPPSRRTGR